jgi:putative Holliday junction resolvase
LAELTSVPVRLMDERLSTVQAQRGLQAAGRSTRQSRSVIDSASAVIVLQAVLDQESATGVVPGELVPGRRA